VIRYTTLSVLPYEKLRQYGGLTQRQAAGIEKLMRQMKKKDSLFHKG